MPRRLWSQTWGARRCGYTTTRSLPPMWTGSTGRWSPGPNIRTGRWSGCCTGRSGLCGRHAGGRGRDGSGGLFLLGSFVLCRSRFLCCTGRSGLRRVLFGVVVLEGTALLPIDCDGRNGQARRLGSQQDGGARAADGQRQGHDESRHSLSHATVGPLCGCIIRNR